jgi:hypothetical protein
MEPMAERTAEGKAEKTAGGTVRAGVHLEGERCSARPGRGGGPNPEGA